VANQEISSQYKRSHHEVIKYFPTLHIIPANTIRKFLQGGQKLHVLENILAKSTLDAVFCTI